MKYKNEKKYDCLIIGSGLFGAVCAHELKKHGFKILIIEKRSHVGGNIYTRNIEGINVHQYGAHIFHTSNEAIWRYVNQFAKFNNFINSPLANYNGKFYHLPFNMNTFREIWPDVLTKDDAMKHIEAEKNACNFSCISTLEEQAISMVGKTIYEILIKGYTEKQWGCSCDQLPPSIIKRIPLRFEYNNNYFDDTFQGIPIGGYTQIIKKMISECDLWLNCDYLSNKNYYDSLAELIIFTGPIDAFFGYRFGKLEYRSLEFETKILNISDFQHNAVVNYTSHEIPFTRIIEHKHFEGIISPKTIITKEFPKAWDTESEPFYPVNNEKNQSLYSKYFKLTKSLDKRVFFGGRMGQYKYNDMDDTIEQALHLIDKIVGTKQQND